MAKSGDNARVHSKLKRILSGSDKCDGIFMDALISGASQALAAGDPLMALKLAGPRNDPAGLALQGIAIAQIGDLPRARALLHRAAHGFGRRGDAAARARCAVASAEIALVLRDLNKSIRTLPAAQAILDARQDRANAAHATYLHARCLLLAGRLGDADHALSGLNTDALSAASLAGYWLVACGIAIRRFQAKAAQTAIKNATHAARKSGIASLTAEVNQAGLVLVVDACRHAVRTATTVIALAHRPVLFALLRTLAEAWPNDAPRTDLLARIVGGHYADESHRARLRVEIGRLRKMLRPLAQIHATQKGFALAPLQCRRVSVITHPVEGKHADVRSLLADGCAWPSSALALALNRSPRTVQRALQWLEQAGFVEACGHGPARRWLATSPPGFPTAPSLHFMKTPIQVDAPTQAHVPQHKQPCINSPT